VSERLIGRDAELAAIESFLDAVPAGAALDLAGDPGIGKTALWSEACERARRRGYRVLASRPGEFETALAYTALGDLLEDVLDEALLALPSVRRSALERALLRVEERGRPPDQRAIALALRDALRLLASEPVVVAIDDTHWLDASSTSALLFASRRLGEAPVGVLTTRRLADTDLETSDSAAGFVASGTTVRVAPLDQKAIDDLIRSRFGTSLPRSAVREIRRVCRGNPFFAIELARASVQEEARPLGADTVRVPRSLRDLLGERVAELEAGVRHALLVVAAASQPTVGLVETVLGSRRRAFDVLSAAVSDDVLRVERGRLRFKHPLLASIVYGDAGREQQRRVHAELADAVEDVEERAYHLALATELPDAMAASTLDKAAARASARGAPAAAAEFAEHALRLTRTDDDDAVARRTLLATDALWAAGETSRARSLLDGLAATMVPGPERAHTLRRLARARAYEDGFAAALEPLEHALAEVGDDLRLRAALERDVALAIMNAGDVRLAAPHAQAALDASNRLADPELSADAEATNDVMRFLLGVGVPVDLEARARRLALAGEERDVHPGFLARAHILASMLKWSDNFAAARSVFEELRRGLAEREEEGPLVPVLFHLGELECWAGNLRLAEAIAGELEAIAPRLGPTTASQALYVSALLAVLRGEVDDANRAATRGLELAEGRDVRLVLRNLKVLGFVGLSIGDSKGANRWLGRAADLAAANGMMDPGFLRLAGDAIEGLVGVGELDRAEHEATGLESLGRRLERPWALAIGARSQALVAAARADLSEALSSLERALAAHERLPEPLERGRTLLALGSVHRRARRKRLARETLAEAEAIFESLPAPLWAERARNEAARIGGRVARRTELTEAERRIAELVADGRSNAEVASELVVSRKTVEWNLSNVYRKLGVRSRTELARRASKQR
jgi:DNA-binding CsgD family transcriptional regulator